MGGQFLLDPTIAINKITDHFIMINELFCFTHYQYVWRIVFLSPTKVFGIIIHLAV